MADSPRGLPVKETIRLNHVRKVMARAMKHSVERAALSQVNREIDVTTLQDYRREAAGDGTSVLSLNTFLMAAVARTLLQNPLLNAELVEDEILVYETVNLGMAVALPEGLVVVVIHDAHARSMGDLDAAIRKKVDRAHSGGLEMADVEGGTFTVSNLGMYGIDGGFPLPRPPEGAILLVGAARPRPAVVDGEIIVRDVARFSLNFDHRFIDGAAAAAFLQDLNEVIVEPEALWERG